MAFSWFFKPKKNNKTLGVNLGNGDGIKAEIDKMQGSIVKASRGYQNNIKKYKDIAQFNQHLTKSYVANMKVIVDVSELLNSYTGVFNSLKDEFAKMEEAMGRQLDKSDFEYLESLTKSKMEQLQTEFNKQASGIKKLYAQYGKPEELNRILLAQNDMRKALDSADTTYTNILSDIKEKETTTNSSTNVDKQSNTTKIPMSSVETITLKEQALINATLHDKTSNSANVQKKSNTSKNATSNVNSSNANSNNANSSNANSTVTTETYLNNQSGGKKSKKTLKKKKTKSVKK